VIVDTSALIAVIFEESDVDEYIDALGEAPTSISAATLLEVSIVVDASGRADMARRLEDLLDAIDVKVEPVTAEHAQIGRRAYRDYGRGSGHAARLNFGDCFAYALAKASGEPLLFKGSDFAQTDVRSALAPRDTSS
jgi:ribonuclease VapC